MERSIIKVSSCKTFDTLYVTKTLDDNAFLYKYLMSFERGILIWQNTLKQILLLKYNMVPYDKNLHEVKLLSYLSLLWHDLVPRWLVEIFSSFSSTACSDFIIWDLDIRSNHRITYGCFVYELGLFPSTALEHAVKFINVTKILPFFVTKDVIMSRALIHHESCFIFMIPIFLKLIFYVTFYIAQKDWSVIKNLTSAHAVIM